MSNSLTDIFKESPAPDENEMNDSSSQTNISEETLAVHSTSPASPRAHCHPNELIHQIKTRFRPPRYEMDPSHDTSHDRNNGFLLVEPNTSQLVFISSDHLDQQMTRHAIDCVHGEIQDESTENQLETPVTPNLIPPSSSSTLTAAPVTSSIDTNDSHPQLDIQATRGSVELVALMSEFNVADETEFPTNESTSSSSSTNASNTEEYLDTTDFSTLTDDAYIQAQKSARDRIMFFETEQMGLLRTLREACVDDDPDFDIDQLYNETFAEYQRLTTEFNQLTERRDLATKPWNCELCTFENQSFILSGKNVCEVCGGPSPLKRLALTS